MDHVQAGAILTAMAGRVESLESRYDSTTERMMAMMAAHHKEINAMRQAETDRLAAELQVEKDATTDLRTQMEQLAQQNAELKSVNEQFGKRLAGAGR